MPVVQMPRDPEFTAAEAEVNKYGTNLALARRYELWILADHLGIPYPDLATKDVMISILRGHNISDQQISQIPELVKHHAARFQRQREQAIKELEAITHQGFPEPVEEKPSFDYGSLTWNELRKHAQDRGLRTYGIKRPQLVAQLEALDGQDRT